MGDALPLPTELAERLDGWEPELWYHYDHRDATYRLTGPDGRRFLKIREPGYHPTLRQESERTSWVRAWLPVPTVLGWGTDAGVEWLLTEELTGVDATDRGLRSDPEALVAILARGLRRFHEVPVEPCPFDFRLDTALAHVRERVAGGVVQPDDFHPEYTDLSMSEVLERLDERPPGGEELVVCHGDYCLPNVLIEGGEAVGFIDLGELGVADRWWDLAVATWSLDWNLGPGYRDLFLAEYGVPLDPVRCDYYRLLYDVVS